jgi:hypothetical protein
MDDALPTASAACFFASLEVMFFRRVLCHDLGKNLLCSIFFCPFHGYHGGALLPRGLFSLNRPAGIAMIPPPSWDSLKELSEISSSSSPTSPSDSAAVD